MGNRTLEMHISRKGAADVIQPIERTLSPPGPGEVCVSIEAAGVAVADIVMRRGLYPGCPVPITPGYDFVGRIEALGPGVVEFKVGQRVAAVTITGSYATRRNVDVRWLVLAPEQVDAAMLVAATLNGLTAWQMFDRVVRLEAGEWILVHGAAGGVGSLLLDFAKMAGVNAIGTASAGKRPFVEARGAVAIDYKNSDIVEQVRRVSDGGVIAAFDHLGGKHFKNISMAALRPGGTAIVYGGYNATRDGKVRPLAIADLLLGKGVSTHKLMSSGKGIAGYSSPIWRDQRPDAYRQDLAAVLAMVGSGRLKPLIGARYPLQQAAEAQRALETRAVAGKIVLMAD